MMLRRVGLSLKRQRTQLSNTVQAHLVEFGIAASIGRNGREQLLDEIADLTDERVPADARFCLKVPAAELCVRREQVLEKDDVPFRTVCPAGTIWRRTFRRIMI